MFTLLSAVVIGGLTCASAGATPGPDSVAVVANIGHSGGKALLAEYGDRRHIPSSQRCTVDVPPFVDIDALDFRNKVALPLLQCLLAGKALERIEAIVLLRGMPRRVAIDFGDGTLKVSLAAALSIYQTTVGDKAEPILGKSPGFKGLCGDGVPCWAATWKNPYQNGPFAPDWHRKTGVISWKMWLVTALDGYTDKDARLLIDAAIAAENLGDNTKDLKARWLLMKGADSARGVLDSEFADVKQQLSGYVPGPVVVEKFQNDLVGEHLLAFVTGTSKLGKTIEGNTFAPGALVDNLTSLGAVPTNFNAPEAGGQQAQVSIARWVRAGATGVHGTVAEPLNNCFPSRHFLVDYASGATLAEAYWANLPFVYWMNLIIGDPMVAPFAKRPKISVQSEDGLTGINGETMSMPGSGNVRLRFNAQLDGESISMLRIFVDGAMAASVTDASVELQLAAGDHHIVAVAQAAKSASGAGVWQSKGWAGWFAKAVVKPGDDEGNADAASTDANAADAGKGDKPVGPAGGDDGCHATRVPHDHGATLALVLLVGLIWWSRRRAGV